jgi:general stress protein YciG
MDREKQRQIASKGGKAAHAKGRAHEWTVEEAREAGRKGGAASHRPPPATQPDTDDHDRDEPLMAQPSQAEG